MSDLTGLAMRQAIERLQGSLIREIANAGMGRADVLLSLIHI